MERLARLIRRLFPVLVRPYLPGGSPRTSRAPARGAGRFCKEYRTHRNRDTLIVGGLRDARLREALTQPQTERFRGRTCCEGCRAVSETLPERVLEPAE